VLHGCVAPNPGCARLMEVQRVRRVVRTTSAAVTGGLTVGGLVSEDIVILASSTIWEVPWELMLMGPFVSCGLLDGQHIRHVTVPAMVASAVRNRSTPSATLVADDYPRLPVFAAQMPLLDAAVLVAETGWELAVVMADEPRVVTARTVYRALLGPVTMQPARPHGGAACGLQPASRIWLGRDPWCRASGQGCQRCESDLVGLDVVNVSDR